MGVREFLILLNAVVMFAVLAAYVLGGEQLNVIGETDDEQKRNEKGIKYWYAVAVVIGMIALPFMVAREIWQWKKYKLPHIEWDDIGRYGLAIVFGTCLHLLVLVFTSCSSAKPIVTERVVYKTDTMYKTKHTADTFRILDSVFVNQYIKGDTVYKEKTAWKWRDKIVVRVDTIYKASVKQDSVRVPVPVERKLSAWEKTLLWSGKTFILIITMVVVSLLLWLIHRKK